MDFRYKKSGTVFNMHSYWTKQPIDPIVYFINKYTKQGNVVLDPFSGTGMTGVAAILSNRKAILNDLSPTSIHISKGYCTDYRTQEKIKLINEVKTNILKEISKYYETKCVKCGNQSNIRFSIVGEVWKNKDGTKKENRGLLMLNNSSGTKFNKDYVFDRFELIKICYVCECTKGKQTKTPDQEDIKKWNTNNYKNLFYPKDDFFGQEPKRNFKRGIKKVYQLYSPRNLTALAIINDKISKIRDKDIKQLFKFTFTSILFNSSLMSRYRDYENTSIKMGTFYVPPLIKDTNVASNFINKLNLIIKGNSEIFRNKYPYQIKYHQGSAGGLKDIPSNSIDYIYADPPYSDIINYSELNIVFESWLKRRTDTRDEMIVSKHQGKSIANYSTIFKDFLNESYRVLKSGSVLTIVFHHPNIDHWKHLQKVIIDSKFEPIFSPDPIRLISGSKTSSQHKTNKKTQCFLVFNLKKSDKQKSKLLKKLTLDITESIEKEAISKGYSLDSDKFDYLINKLMFKYDIDSNFIR